MSTNVYQSSFGLFSVIADDNVLNAVRNLSESGNIYDSNEITNYGQEVIATIPFSSVHGTIACNDISYKPEPYINLTNLSPNWVIVQVDATTTRVNTDYVVSNDKIIRTEKRCYGTIQDLRWYSELRIANSYYSDVNGITPYGFFTTATAGGSQANRITLMFFVSNSDMNDFIVCYMVFTTNTIYFRRSNSGNNSFLTNYFDGLTPIYIDTDPFSNGGTTGNDDTEGVGGTGDFDGTSDPIDFPNLPNLSAVDTGFITLFNPSASQLKALANYMWSGLFDLDTFKKIFADPMDCILGLSIVPVNVPSGSSDTVKVGNISTGVSMTKATSQYVSVDCGTLNVNEFWGAYLDYSPYTKAEIYLPYVGTHPLDIDDIMNKPVHVKYHIDILSGACIAFVKCGDSVLYSFIGQCSSSIPITGNDWTNVINGVINIAGAVGSMVMTGGMSAPMAIGQIASTAVNSSKPSVEKSGSLSGTGGMLGVQTPYMILTRPKQALPAQQNAYTGYPSFITRTLSSVSGYTEVDRIHLENVPGTESELSEIELLLKTGVIF